MGRSSKKGLPKFLHERNGTYYYHNPKAGFHNQPMGGDRHQASQAARQLNAMANPEVESLITKAISPNSHSLSDTIKRFRKEIIPNLKLAELSEKHMGYRLNRLDKDLGSRLLDLLDVKAIAEYLDANFSGDGYKQHRALLSRLFRFAITKGWCKSDPVDMTLPTRSAERIKKQRQRLTKEQFDAIYNVAEEWLQIAMDMALITLQRRGDLVSLKFTDIKDRRLYLVQQKTEKWGDAARLSIGMGPWLTEVVERSRSSGVLTPLIIHRRPLRHQSRQQLKGSHWSSVKPNYLSRAFALARDKTGLFDKVAAEEKPTFHEIRSLGGTLYRESGWSKEQVQALMGHTSVEMTQEYLDGHEKWTEVEAVLEK